MSLTIDFAKLDVIKSLVPVQQVQSLSSKKGLYFLFDTEKELVYIGSTMNSLKQRVFAHLKSGDFQENQPIAFIGWLEIEGSKETIEALKMMLINAYFPIYNQYGIKYKHKRPLRAEHTNCQVEVKKAAEPATSKVKKVVGNKRFTSASVKEIANGDEAKRLWSRSEARAILHLSDAEIITLSERLLTEQYFFQRDMKKNLIFTLKDLVVMQVLLNITQHHVVKKREMKEAIRLVQKFGLIEALRISERLITKVNM